jgi:hypothetical protein
VPAHRFSSDDGAISWQQAPFPPSDEWNLGNRERPSTVREEDRLRHYLWFSFSCAGAAAVQDQSHGRGGWMIDESRDAPQLEAALLFEYEMMRIETYSRQPDLMFHANDFRVSDRFQLGLAILRGAFSQRGDCQSAYGVL